MISVRILAPDLVEVTVRPSWWRRLLGARAVPSYAELNAGQWRWIYDGADDIERHISEAIERAFRAETALNYQAAAQRGEYPIR